MDEQEEKKIQEILEENIRINKEIYEICLKTKKFLYATQIYSIIKTIIIVIPIVIAIIYFLPIFKDFLPLMKSVTNQYKDLLGIPVNSVILR